MDTYPEHLQQPGPTRQGPAEGAGLQPERQVEWNSGAQQAVLAQEHQAVPSTSASADQGTAATGAAANLQPCCWKTVPLCQGAPVLC